MPLYDYKCESCGFVKEYLDRKRRTEKTRPCEKCGADSQRVEIAPFSSDLQGQGFKITDYPSIDRLVGADARKKWQKYEDKYLNMKKLIEENPGKEVVRGDDGNYKLSE